MGIWNCRKKQIEYGKSPVIMGIVNVTPDSFSDGGEHFTSDDAIEFAMKLLRDGADIIDIGAQSTRPGYEEVSPEEEWERLRPVLEGVRERTDAVISVDTYFYSVAEKALGAGADIINDVSGLLSKKMMSLIKDTGAGWVITHNGEGSVREVRDFFKSAVETTLDFDIRQSQLCFDMGIGFDKDNSQNLELIANVDMYKEKGYPLLLGVSRKRVIGFAGGEFNPQNRTYGNIAADTAAIFGGADIFRIHDVKNEKQGIKTAWEIKKWIK